MHLRTINILQWMGAVCQDNNERCSLRTCGAVNQGLPMFSATFRSTGTCFGKAVFVLPIRRYMLPGSIPSLEMRLLECLTRSPYSLF
jgi:hypothetical protein